MSTVKFINTRNIRIARENMSLDTLFVSRKISKKGEDVVHDWELGESLPSWAQVRKLAKVYRISELLLTSKKEISRLKSIPDYRVGKDGNDDFELRKLINLVIKRQSWLERSLREKGFKKNSLVGSGIKYSNPSELAHYINKKLEIDFSGIRGVYGFGARKKLLDYLIDKAEQKGIFVGKTISYHKIKVDDMRGLFIANEYCPFIILNRKDAISAQIFSFVHELAHLFRKTEAISNSLDFRASNKEVNPEEVFCNKVAAELLLPEKDFIKNYYEKSDVDQLSEIYKVSKIFIFYRLKDLRRIQSDRVDEIEREIKRETQRSVESRQKERATGGNYIYSMKDSNGRLFNRIVSSSYHEDNIGYVEASKLLCFSVEKI